ncbi:ubiquitin-binding protein cue5 [Saxophila tyrrhenica]|uniref:Ubiquitin-binding protein cue5 n=1 Tax=Saxophila tyrrhenica TaxID=1690608 RepID=A0AAV9P5V3_9PEZI|nr:ubiquitin-binding protein cue5 [Saxophila tyrrhenica]
MTKLTTTSLLYIVTLSSISIARKYRAPDEEDIRSNRRSAMAEAPPVSPLKEREESATTREELDFDDDAPEQETGRVSPMGHETPTQRPHSARKSVSFQDPQDDAPPPAKPPRPLSPQQQAENTLIEAFPSIDTKVVKAVLNASGGKVEPAFNALLGMSDPSFVAEQEPAAPPRPPRPAQREPVSQLEADERYARQLAEHYNTETPRSQTRYNQREPGRRGVNAQPQQRGYSPSPERNFFDDDLPEIGRNIQQGFFETQKKVNSWITTFKKRIDGEEGDEDEEDLYGAGTSRQDQDKFLGRQNFGPSQSDQLRGIRKQAEAQSATRRSTEATRYDADPHELNDDEFERLELRDEESAPAMPPRTSSRKAPNPDLFKSAPQAPSGPIDEVDAAERSASSSGQEGEKSKKWQPLTSVAPNPEEDNDPFSLGDDEEGEKGEDLRKEDSARLKEAARNSVSAGGSGEGPEAQQLTGTKNKDMEELLAAGGGKKE